MKSKKKASTPQEKLENSNKSLKKLYSQLKYEQSEWDNLENDEELDEDERDSLLVETENVLQSLTTKIGIFEKQRNNMEVLVAKQAFELESLNGWWKLQDQKDVVFEVSGNPTIIQFAHQDESQGKIISKDENYDVVISECDDDELPEAFQYCTWTLQLHKFYDSVEWQSNIEGCKPLTWIRTEEPLADKNIQYNLIYTKNSESIQIENEYINSSVENKKEELKRLQVYYECLKAINALETCHNDKDDLKQQIDLKQQMKSMSRQELSELLKFLITAKVQPNVLNQTLKCKCGKCYN